MAEQEQDDLQPQKRVTAEDYKDVELQRQKLSTINFSTEQYEGPLELLWELIRREKFDIFHVDLTSITGQYLEQIAEMKRLDLEIAGEYLDVAGLLLQFKSRKLLPTSLAPPDEEEDEGQREADLEKRLQEYLIYKELANELGKSFEKRQRQFSRPAPAKLPDRFGSEEEEEVEFVDVDLDFLYETFKKVLDEVGQSRPSRLSDEEFTVEEKIEEMRLLMLEREDHRFNLSQHLRQMESKLEIITTFLALLESIRLRLIRAQQLKSTMEIYVVAVLPPEEWVEDDSEE